MYNKVQKSHTSIYVRIQRSAAEWSLVPWTVGTNRTKRHFQEWSWRWTFTCNIRNFMLISGIFSYKCCKHDTCQFTQITPDHSKVEQNWWQKLVTPWREVTSSCGTVLRSVFLKNIPEREFRKFWYFYLKKSKKTTFSVKDFGKMTRKIVFGNLFIDRFHCLQALNDFFTISPNFSVYF